MKTRALQIAMLTAALLCSHGHGLAAPNDKAAAAAAARLQTGQTQQLTPRFNAAAGTARRADNAQALSQARGPRPPVAMQNSVRQLQQQQAEARARALHLQALQNQPRPK